MTNNFSVFSGFGKGCLKTSQQVSSGAADQVSKRHSGAPQGYFLRGKSRNPENSRALDTGFRRCDGLFSVSTKDSIRIDASRSHPNRADTPLAQLFLPINQEVDD
ncbi:MAG: hypothetical protein IPJ48_09995 [Propionivibrio sp.]|uniref:Uncharacterized protein n=1 Tax=Candidatus Propionivibrio dominans TaxID=2954373 RepID=A0A9D7FFK7_9RHOO|nr:hypothetical protein [Candidatus Propionivibrio dominans]MBL0168739.1 hypothetical protein [Propionivibrio sp.]